MGRVACVAATALAACVPEGPPTEGSSDEAEAVPPIRPSLREPPPTSEPLDARSAPPLDPPLGDGFRDDFERDELGDDWRDTGGGWHIEGGALCARDARNHPVWLRRRLPRNARIRFTATSASADGDLKVEAWGDGRSAARRATYDHATGYVVIFGGWHNQRHVLARLDEHGPDRLVHEVRAGADDVGFRAVVPSRTYRFTLERRDGRTLRWLVDDHLMHALDDTAPLFGPGHDHFGFNDWAAPVCFDALRIEPL